MSLPKKKLNDLNKQVIQRIIAFQIKEKTPSEAPLLFERTSPKNVFYLPNKPLLKASPQKTLHQTNKSMDSLPNFRITSKKPPNILMKSVEKEQILVEMSIKPSKTATGYFSSPKPTRKEFSLEVVLPNEQAIPVFCEDFEEKTIKALKSKILAEIHDFEEEEKLMKIVAFKTVKKLYLIDFVMNSDAHSLDFFHTQEKLQFTPFYRESSFI